MDKDMDRDMDRDLVTFVTERSVRLRDRMIQFLRDLIAIPSPGCGEEAAVKRVGKEMKDLGFDSVNHDVLGNVVGTLGTGPIEVLYDAHLDTVNVGSIQAWAFDPFLGRVDDKHVYGLGASNSKGAMAAILYAAYILRESEALKKVTLRVVGSVMEEECEGLCYRSLLNSGLVNPHIVVLGKCTDLAVCRGQRGRLECRAEVFGQSTHATAPELGRNATYEAAAIISRIEKLNRDLPRDPFLGKGSIEVTRIESAPGPVFITPKSCFFYIDRRLTKGESRDRAIKEIRDLAGSDSFKIEVLRYDRPSYTGQILEVDRYYPQWELKEDHPCTQAAIQTVRQILDQDPDVTRWSLSTNGVYTKGVAGIPTFGFGPGREEDTYSINDRVSIDQLMKCMQFYALFPEAVAERQDEVMREREEREAQGGE